MNIDIEQPDAVVLLPEGQEYGRAGPWLPSIEWNAGREGCNAFKEQLLSRRNAVFDLVSARSAQAVVIAIRKPRLHVPRVKPHRDQDASFGDADPGAPSERCADRLNGVTRGDAITMAEKAISMLGNAIRAPAEEVRCVPY